jgi:lysyl-tRNA synthetase class 2
MDTTNLVTVEGRIDSIRKSGRGMYFIDVVQDSCKLQLVVNNKLMGISKDEFDEIHLFFRKGDLVATKGYPGVTNVGELSLKLSSPIVLLSPRLCQVPNKLSDKKIINSNRVMNYLVNPKSKDAIIAKSKIIQSIRTFLIEKQFLEVTTPILAGSGTGANAKPFITHFHGSGVHLRVAPELWLKKMVIGGFDKIFEIGQNFRNEGVDATHNPEFTSCEFYQTYTSLDQLMELTEELFSKVHSDLSSSLYLDHLCCFQDKYPKFEFIPILEKKTGHKLPSTINSETLQQYYDDIGIDIPENKSASNLLDNLSGIYLESISEEIEYQNTPIFIYNQPEVLSPLAKSAKKHYDGREYAISRRFELFINGKEYVNAYEEENDPAVQLQKFNEQQQAKTDFNDAESLVPDWQFVSVMEYGLPPTGGWGCGIDRLAMLFSGAERIDEVLPFGNLRDVQKQ